MNPLTLLPPSALLPSPPIGQSSRKHRDGLTVPCSYIGQPPAAASTGRCMNSGPGGA